MSRTFLPFVLPRVGTMTIACAVVVGCLLTPGAGRGAEASAEAARSTKREEPLARDRMEEVFIDVLGREPTRTELRDLQRENDGCTETRFRDDLRGTREYRELTPERVIRRAYRDLLNRDPDPEGMRTYRRLMIDRGWSAGQVRVAIQKSDEYRTHRFDSIIERAYEDMLERKPDPSGMEHYRSFLRNGGSEQQMRANLRDSVEYRVLLPDAKTTRAYREVLRRAPDQSGLESYRRKIVDEGWSERDVKDALRRSDEFRNLRK